MARSATVIQTQIDSLRNALGAGVLIVQHGTDRVQYQTFEEMRKALALLLSELDSVNGTTPRSRVNYINQKSKGFGQSGPGGFVGSDFTEFD